MSGIQIDKNTPLIVTFHELATALEALHLWDRAEVDRLHDVWKTGAPTPNSIIRNPKGYDERKRQAGNHEARIIPPTWLMKWIMDVCERRGWPITERQALAIIAGDDRALTP